MAEYKTQQAQEAWGDRESRLLRLEDIKEYLCEHFTHRPFKQIPHRIGEGKKYYTIDDVVEYIASNPIEPNSTIRKDFQALRACRIIPLAYDNALKTTLLGVCYEEDADRLCDVVDPHRFSMDLSENMPLAVIQNSSTYLLLLDRNEFTKLEEYYHKPDKAINEIEERRKPRLDVSVVQRDIYKDMEARRIFNVILASAIQRGATDIHIEPGPKTDVSAKKGEIAYGVRLRIDGALERFAPITQEKGDPLIGVLKVDSEMNVSEHRRAQDKKISLSDHKNYSNEPLFRDYQLRIATLPTVYGEKVAIRILKKDPEILNLERLGFPDHMREKIHKLCDAPQGVFLVTGPTGSGKTTTLYAILSKLNKEEDNIVTIEDPVEITLPGVNQVQVNRDANLVFPNAVRTFLRQDPDIILVGETRDDETAKATFEAGKTGHFVLTTLHTNGAIPALNRLYDMGVNKLDLQDSLIGVLAQRLVRKVCDECKAPVEGRENLERLLGAEIGGEITLWKGAPRSEERKAECKVCNGTGYFGRIVVPELWVIGEGERKLIGMGKSSTEEYLDLAVHGGMTPLIESGLGLLLDGKTTISELLRNVAPKTDFEIKREYLIKIIQSHNNFRRE